MSLDGQMEVRRYLSRRQAERAEGEVTILIQETESTVGIITGDDV
jgi:hypothetical protein